MGYLSNWQFNADTPTSLFESAIVQWAMLKYNNLEESSQFNGTYEALVANFKKTCDPREENVDDFEEGRYEKGWKFCFAPSGATWKKKIQ